MDIGLGNQVIAAYWSDDFRHMIGYNSVQDFPNTLESWSNLLHPADKDRTLNLFAQTLGDRSGKTKYDLEYRLKTKNKDYRWYRATGSVQRNQHGDPIQFIGIFVDVHDEHQRKFELDRLLKRYSAISDVTTHGSFYIRLERIHSEDLPTFLHMVDDSIAHQGGLSPPFRTSPARPTSSL